MTDVSGRCQTLNGIKGALRVLLIAGFAWAGTAAQAAAIDLTYAAYRMGDPSATPVREGEMIGAGEKLIIKIRYLNDSQAPTQPGFVVFTLPSGCAFVKAERSHRVEVSVDGGEQFGPLERLAVVRNGRLQPAVGADVTHLRLALERPVASGDGGEISVIATHE